MLAIQQRTNQQGRIHGQYQSRTDGQGRKCWFFHFSTHVHGPTDRPTDGRTDGRMDGRTDKASYRVACPQLKMVMVLILVTPDLIKRVKKKSRPSLYKAPNWSIWIIRYPHCLNFIYLFLLCFQWRFHPYNFQRLPKAWGKVRRRFGVCWLLSNHQANHRVIIKLLYIKCENVNLRSSSPPPPRLRWWWKLACLMYCDITIYNVTIVLY